MRKILLTLIVLLTGLHIFANDEKQYELTALINIAGETLYKETADVLKLLDFIKEAKKDSANGNIENSKDKLKKALEEKKKNDTGNGSTQINDSFDLLFKKGVAKVKVRIANKALTKKYHTEIEGAKEQDIDKISKEWEETANKFNKLYWEADEKFKNEIDTIENNSSGVDIAQKILDKIEEKTKQQKEPQKPQAPKQEKPMLNEKDYKLLDAFYYKNNNIFDKLKGDVFLNLKFGSDLINTNGLLGSLLIGGTYSFKELNFNLGGFIQYDKQISDNYALGLTFQYDNLSSFLRYRLATYDKKLNHNIDAYISYKYTFDIGDIKISPISSIYTTISAPTKLDDYILNTRFGFDLNIGTEIKYKLANELEIFTIPTITVSYNDQVLIKGGKPFPKTRSYFDYHLNIGLNYEDDGIRLSPIIKLTGDINGNVKFTTELGMGYIF